MLYLALASSLTSRIRAVSHGRLAGAEAGHVVDRSKGRGQQVTIRGHRGRCRARHAERGVPWRRLLGR